MKLGTLADPRFKTSFAKLQSAPLSLKVAFKLRSIDKVVLKELATYEETRQAALNKYGKKNEDGSLLTLGVHKSVQFEEGMFEKFVEELAELNAVEVSIEKVTAAELGDVKLSGDDLSVLEDLIEF